MVGTALIALALLSGGLLAGGQFVLALAVAPAMRGLAGADYVRLHQLLDARMDPVLPAIGWTSIGAATGLIVFAEPLPAKIAYAGTVVLTGAVGMMSARVNKPINRQVVSWEIDALPTHWSAMRSRWITANLVRTVWSGMALVSSTAGTLLRVGSA